MPPSPSASPEPSRRPTLRDVAKQAGGVHPSTVSLAMRNHPGISEALRRKIKAAAKTIGYRPDPLLDAFNSHRVAVLPNRALASVAWIIDGPSRKEWLDHPYHGRLWQAASRAAEGFRCHLEPFLLGPGQLTAARLDTVLKTRNITGLILAHLSPDTSLEGLDFPHYRALRVETGHLDYPGLAVGVDHRQALRLSWTQLRQQGCRKIGFASTGAVGPSTLERYDIAWTFAQASLPADERGARAHPLTSPEALVAWVQKEHLSGVIVDDYRLAASAAPLWPQRQWPVPWAALDASLAPASVPGPVVDVDVLATQALEQVVALLRSQTPVLADHAVTTLVPPTWRASTLFHP